ncbi:MAG: ABC-2 transporter permease [Lactobacillales bacterium]|jgi:hypothetical protein|nr:ABC-2 transporter permease [Lactobacillales bacterium]
MNKNLINLVKKDLVITKYVAPIAIFLGGYAICSYCLLECKEFNFFSNVSFAIFFEIIEIIQYFGAYFYHKVKNHQGVELLMTTSYKREEIVLSKYLHWFLIPAVYLVILLLFSISLPDFHYAYLLLMFCFFYGVNVLCISILIPLYFYIQTIIMFFFIFIPMNCIFTGLFMLFLDFVSKHESLILEMIKCVNNFFIFVIILLIITIVLCISIFISKKILARKNF